MSGAYSAFKKYFMRMEVAVAVFGVVAVIGFVLAIVCYSGVGNAASNRKITSLLSAGDGLVLEANGHIGLSPIGAGTILSNPRSSTLGAQPAKPFGPLTRGALLVGGSTATPLHEVLMAGPGKILTSDGGVTPAWSAPLAGASFQVDTDPTTGTFFLVHSLSDPPTGLFVGRTSSTLYATLRPSFIDMQAVQLIQHVQLLVRVLVDATNAGSVGTVSIDAKYLVPGSLSLTSPNGPNPQAFLGSAMVSTTGGEPVGNSGVATLAFTSLDTFELRVLFQSAVPAGEVLTLMVSGDIPVTPL